MSARWRRLWRSDDSGASLIFALIFISVVSLVVAAVLGLADASMRSVVSHRSVAAETAAVEGAANIAVNALRKSTYVGTGGCFGGTSQVSVPSTQLPGPQTISARVVCTPQSALATAPVAAPAQTLLTLHGGSASLTPVGILVAPTSGTAGFRVAGNVHSNASIVLGLGNLTTTGGTIRARRACSTFPLGTISPTPSCNTGTVLADPGYAVPSVSGLPVRSVPACAPIMPFQPGRYTDLVALTHRASAACQGGNGILHFPGGIYSFDFPTLAVAWLVTAGTIIAGDLAPGVTLTPGVPPAVPGSCHSPIPSGPGWTVPNPDNGVLFHFSGESGFSVSSTARVEICGRYGGNAPSLAMVAQPHTGIFSSICDNSTFPCAALWGTQPTAFRVNGTVYLPTREVVLTLNNSSNQSFRGGVIARRIWVTTSRTSTTPVIEVPTVVTAQRRTVVDLEVRVCPGQATCTSGGTVGLRARVQINDPSGIPVAGQRQMSVLTWSLQQ